MDSHVNGQVGVDNPIQLSGGDVFAQLDVLEVVEVAFALVLVMALVLLGTFLLCVLPPLIIDNQTLANNDSSRVWRGVMVAVTVLTVVISGMETSGAMYNPTLASLLVGGCKGFSTGQHLLVYWITPIVGAAFASVLQQYINRPSVGSQKKKK